jgi:hypothetical protein
LHDEKRHPWVQIELPVTRQLGMKGLDHLTLIVLAHELEISQRHADLVARARRHAFGHCEKLAELAQPQEIKSLLALEYRRAPGVAKELNAGHRQVNLIELGARRIGDQDSDGSRSVGSQFRGAATSPSALAARAQPEHQGETQPGVLALGFYSQYWPHSIMYKGLRGSPV